jgi:hypothetical protein
VALDPHARRDLAGATLASCDGEDALDGGRVGRVLRGQPASHGATGQRGGRRRERSGVGGVERGSEVVGQVGLVAEQCGLAGEDRRHVAIGDGVEER